MEWGGGTIPALSANNVKMGGVNLAEPTFYGSESLYAKWMTSGETRQGDVLLTMEAPLGNVAQVPDSKKYILSQRVVLLRFDERRMTNAFATHQMRSERVQRNLVRWSTGTTATGIQRAKLVQVRLAVPPLLEQRNIAGILETIDHTIDRTARIVAKLRDVGRGLLHDLVTKGIDDSGQLRDPERHPNHFKESPLGRIPRDWRVGSLEEWLEGSPRNGHSPKAVDEWTGRLMLGLGCLTPDGFQPVQLKNAPRNDRRLDDVTLSDGDLLVSRANTRDLVGLAGIYRDIGQPCTYPDLMMRLTPNCSLTTASFLELVLRAPRMRRQIQAAAVGTSSSMVKISGAIVKRLQVAMPPLEEQARLVDNVRAAQARLGEEERYGAKLDHVKRGLMEDLLTGRVRVTKPLENAAE